MTPRPRSLLVVAAIAAVLVTACGSSSPSTPELTDPTAIVTAALKSTEAAKSVHVEAAIDGSTPVAIPGLPSTGAPIDLSGTTGSADIDLAGKAAHATFSVPALFNLGGELIVVDGKGYLKTTIGGAQYDRVDLATLPIDVTDVGGMTDTLGDVLLGGDVTLTKGDDVACGSGPCYTVVGTMTPEQLKALLGDATTGLPIDLTGMTLDVVLRVEQAAPNHLSGLTLTSTPPSGAPLKADLSFTKWDEPVTVTAPPADQVKAG